MKKIKTSDITSSVGLPVKSGTIQHLQDSYKELFEVMFKTFGKGTDNTTVYVLYGCENTGSGSNYIISAGAVYYAGEIYLVDAATFTVSGGNVPVATITTTYLTAANADPVTLTNSTTANVHEIRKMVIASGASGSGTANYSAFNFYPFVGNYIDISDSVSVDSSIGVVTKEIRKYIDGTVTVNISGVIASNITASVGSGVDIITGLPDGIGGNIDMNFIKSPAVTKVIAYFNGGFGKCTIYENISVSAVWSVSFSYIID